MAGGRVVCVCARSATHFGLETQHFFKNASRDKPFRTMGARGTWLALGGMLCVHAGVKCNLFLDWKHRIRQEWGALGKLFCTRSAGQLASARRLPES
jgi:hypothetical protein